MSENLFMAYRLQPTSYLTFTLETYSAPVTCPWSFVYHVIFMILCLVMLSSFVLFFFCFIFCFISCFTPLFHPSVSSHVSLSFMTTSHTFFKPFCASHTYLCDMSNSCHIWKAHKRYYNPFSSLVLFDPQTHASFRMDCHPIRYPIFWF